MRTGRQCCTSVTAVLLCAIRELCGACPQGPARDSHAEAACTDGVFFAAVDLANTH